MRAGRSWRRRSCPTSSHRGGHRLRSRRDRRTAPRPRTPPTTPAERRGHHRHAEAHRLERGQPEALIQRRMHERGSTGVELGQPLGPGPRARRGLPAPRPSALTGKHKLERLARPAAVAARTPRAAPEGSCAAAGRRRRGSAAVGARVARSRGSSSWPGPRWATTIRSAGTPHSSRASAAVVSLMRDHRAGARGRRAMGQMRVGPIARDRTRPAAARRPGRGRL